MKIPEKIKKYLPTLLYTPKKMKELVAEAREEERGWWADIKKQLENYSLGVGNTSLLNSPGIKSGFYNLGLRKETKRVKERKRIAEEEHQKLEITDEAVKKWREDGYFNALEVEQFDSREQTPGDLENAQNAAYLATFTDPHVKGTLNLITRYIIGGGVKFVVNNEKIQQWLETNFWNRNKFDLKLPDYIFSCTQQGELFLPLFVEKDGKVNVKKYRTYEITDIETQKEDRDTYLSYEYMAAGLNPETKWVADYTYFDSDSDSVNYQESEHAAELKPDHTILFIRKNPGDEVRGRVPFGESLKYFRMARDFIFDRFILNHERGRVIWVKKSNRRITGLNDNYMPAPPYGVILKIQQNEDLLAVNSQIKADDVKDDYLNILYMAGAGVGVPLMIVDQRAKEENYNSMKKSSNPFHQMIVAERIFYAYHLIELLRFALRRAVEAKTLDKTTEIPKVDADAFMAVLDDDNKSKKKKNTARINTVDIPITIEYPTIFNEDKLPEARALSMFIDRNVISPEGAADLIGVDYKQQLVQLAKYRQFLKTIEVDPDETPAKNIGKKVSP